MIRIQVTPLISETLQLPAPRRPRDSASIPVFDPGSSTETQVGHRTAVSLDLPRRIRPHLYSTHYLTLRIRQCGTALALDVGRY